MLGHDQRDDFPPVCHLIERFLEHNNRLIAVVTGKPTIWLTRNTISGEVRVTAASETASSVRAGSIGTTVMASSYALV